MDAVDYYAIPGRMTHLGPHADALRGIRDLAEAAAVAHGLILHPAWAPRYDVEVSDDSTLQTRSAVEMLDAVLAIDDAPLREPRPAQRRMIGNCRHFATLTCAVLRAAGMPVRARCGFATYFQAGRHVDHWIVEVPDGGGWTRADPQLDALQRAAVSIADPLRLGPGSFLDASQAWGACRDGAADPDTFGIFDMWGLSFVRGNVILDLGALNKVELLPWDAWGLALDGATPEANDVRLDEVSATVRRGSFDDIRTLYENDRRLRVGATVTSFGPDGATEVTLPSDDEEGTRGDR